MEIIIDTFRFLSIGQLLLVLVIILKATIQLPIKVALVSFSIAIMAYLIVDWEVLSPGDIAFYFFLPFAMLTPFAFWIFSKGIFLDDFQLSTTIWTIAIALLIINPLIFCLTYFSIVEGGFATFLGVIQRSIVLLFVILGIVELLKGQAEDLVAPRRKLRKWFIIIVGAFIGLTALTEIAFQQTTTPKALEVIQKAAIFSLSFAFALSQLRFSHLFFPEKEKTNNPAQETEIDQELFLKLSNWMELEKGYRLEGLSIRKLAEQLSVKEYKLRLTINQQLGYRNFNAYLNHFRVEEACQLLADTSQMNRTILDIAYSVGYQSLAPFNKAFKETTGKTPSEWRKAHSNNTNAD